MDMDIQGFNESYGFLRCPRAPWIPWIYPWTSIDSADYRYPWEPWISMKSIDIHGLPRFHGYGYPWVQSIDIDISGFHEYGYSMESTDIN